MMEKTSFAARNLLSIDDESLVQLFFLAENHFIPSPLRHSFFQSYCFSFFVGILALNPFNINIQKIL